MKFRLTCITLATVAQLLAGETSTVQQLDVLYPPMVESMVLYDAEYACTRTQSEVLDAAQHDCNLYYTKVQLVKHLLGCISM